MRRTRHTVLTAIILLAGCATDDNRLGGNHALDPGPDAGAGSGGTAGAGGSGGATQGSGGASGTNQAPPAEVYTVFADQIIWPYSDTAARCLPRKLDIEPDGRVACAIAQVRPATDCGCTDPGYRPAHEGLVAAARARMQSVELCGTEGRPDCESVCFCELEQLTGTAGEQCLAGAPLAALGWCYIDPSQGAGTEASVAGCPATQARKLRFTQDIPANGPFSVLACADHSSWPSLGPENSGATGQACIPSSEGDPGFSAFFNTEVSVELGSRQCSSGVCLANHFNGRVTCPYGQWEPGATPGCSVPGSGAPVEIEVLPQDTTRRAVDAVYCSCRCAGPGPGPFCACPQGYTCAPLVDDFGLAASTAIAGSYCIKNGTEFTGREGIQCDRRVMNCE